MAYVADLARCDYFEGIFSTERLKAVGWLAKGHAYPQRQTELPNEQFRKLLLLLKDPWEPGCFLGWHDCEFCVSERPVRKVFSVIRNVFRPEPEPGPACQILERFGMEIHFGISNLFVPGRDRIFVAPSMIVHYIDAHRYEPPEEFWRAVLDCPEMRSDAYKKALLANGPSDEKWVRHVTGEPELPE